MMNTFSGKPYDCSNKIALVTGAVDCWGVSTYRALALAFK